MKPNGPVDNVLSRGAESFEEASFLTQPALRTKQNFAPVAARIGTVFDIETAAPSHPFRPLDNCTGNAAISAYVSHVFTRTFSYEN